MVGSTFIRIFRTQSNKYQNSCPYTSPLWSILKITSLSTYSARAPQRQTTSSIVCTLISSSNESPPKVFDTVTPVELYRRVKVYIRNCRHEIVLHLLSTTTIHSDSINPSIMLILGNGPLGVSEDSAELEIHGIELASLSSLCIHCLPIQAATSLLPFVAAPAPVTHCFVAIAGSLCCFRVISISLFF